jgi:hypothetical protein
MRSVVGHLAAQGVERYLKGPELKRYAIHSLMIQSLFLRISESTTGRFPIADALYFAMQPTWMFQRNKLLQFGL